MQTKQCLGVAVAALAAAALTAGPTVAAPTAGPAVAAQTDDRTVTYPVVASQDGSTLLDSDGDPFLYLADTVWLAPSRLDQEGLRHLVSTRADQGFTAIQVSLLPFVHLPGGLANAYGSPPVVGTDLARPVEVGARTSDPASPDYDYWDHVDVLLTLAAERDMLVTVVPSWYGYRGEDWRGYVSTEAARAYGEFLGGRLGSHPNLLWLLGGDNNPVGDVGKVPAGRATGDVAEATRVMARAIAATEAVPHLMSYHAARGVSSARFFADQDWHSVAGAYSDELTWGDALDSARSRRPVVMTEAYYDGRERYPLLDRQDLRAQAWWSVLAGAGFAYGHEDVWDLDPGHGPHSDGGAASWQAALHAPSAGDLGVLADTVRDLVPLRPSDEVIVAARGHGPTLGVGALSADDRAGLVYVPDRRWIKVKLGSIAGDRVALSWLDPASGEVKDLGVRESRGMLELRPPAGFDDAVLVLRDH